MKKDYADFKSQLEEALDSSYHVDIENVRSWTSMQALIVVSAIDEKYDVLVAHEDLKAISTLKQLHKLVLQKAS